MYGIVRVLFLKDFFEDYVFLMINEAKEILSNTETVQELKDYVEEHLSIDEEVIHQNINILQEQQEESKSTESSKDRPIKKSNINNNEVK